MPLRLNADQVEPALIRRLVAVDQGCRVLLARIGLADLAEDGLGPEVATDDPHAGPHQRRFDDLALAGAVLLVERGEDASHRCDAGRVVADGASARDRALARQGDLVSEARSAEERGDVVAGPILFRTVEAIAG